MATWESIKPSEKKDYWKNNKLLQYEKSKKELWEGRVGRIGAVSQEGEKPETNLKIPPWDRLDDAVQEIHERNEDINEEGVQR